MKRFLKFIPALAILFLGSALGPEPSALAQQSAAASSAEKPANIEQIIRTFTAKEAEFYHALSQYAFKRDAVIQTIGMGGQITGEYHRVSTFTLDDKGVRFEKINFFPMPTLTEMSVTTEDLEDLGGVQPYALETSKMGQYNFNYVGKEHIDELDLYVFDVSPKVMPDPKKTKERFFQGRIWVDDKDFQIVKARGKGVPEDKNNKYAVFDTYREQVDGRYWFPTYSYADEDLVFGGGQVVHVRARIRYTDYVRAHATVTITDVDDDKPTPQPTPKPTPSPKKP